MKVFFRGKEYTFNGKMKVKELLKNMNLLPEYVIVARVKKGKELEMLLEDEIIEDDDEIRILSAISGGI